MVLRREFLKWLAAGLFSIATGCIYKEEIRKNQSEQTRGEMPVKRTKSNVYVIKTTDRKSGIKELLKYFKIENLSGKRVALKANYNSSDPFPASTHIDTLSAIVEELKERKASVVLAERSGMGDTRKVLEDTGVIELAVKSGFDVVVLDELDENGWILESPDESHWKRGFLFPKVFREADAIVSTCCLR